MNKQKRWDKYFLGLANSVAQNSQCLSRKIGAIIVLDKSIISTGYNGPPRGVPPCDERWGKDDSLEFEFPERVRKGKCPRKAMGYESGEGLEYCIAGHGERNALINAARHGIAVKGATMYCNCPIPCTPCLVEIINAGIIEIVVTNLSHYDKTAEYLIKESGIFVRKYEL
ncbi:MAG TPA: deaminase [Bacteroidales bacterium]|nr:deaminase [Bacteroidales bacterium]